MAHTFIYISLFDAFEDFRYFGSLLFPNGFMIVFERLKASIEHVVDYGVQPTSAYFSARDNNCSDETSIIPYMCIYNESNDYFEEPSSIEINFY